MITLTKKIKKEFGDSKIIISALQLLKEFFKRNEFLFSHSLRTALILKEMGIKDEETIATGILHHLPLPSLKHKEISEKKNNEILKILKKLNQLRELCSLRKSFKPTPIKKWQKSLLNLRAENLRKMIFGIAQDLRPIFVLLAGRLDEMRNLQNFPKDYQQRKSKEALEILAPLAYGVGMGEIKGQLEDLAFPYLYPKEYKWLLKNVKEEYAERKNYIERIKPQLAKILNEKKLKFLDIHARAKHYFSLYQKLLRYEMDLEKIYDLVALRLIVPDIETCYRALGAIHDIWHPLPGRIKDYIAFPKPNGYRSLHTTLLAGENKIIEIQIKTPEMHQEAEYGVASHLSYKEKISQKTYRHQFYWMEQLRKWKEEIKDFKKIAKKIPSELFKGQVFVLTLKKDVISLPKGATCVDFAYAIHSEIGDHCAGAKVNGKMVALNYVLKTGETVEVLTDKNKTPSSDWLRFVKTAKARSKIKNFLQKAYGLPAEKIEKKSFIKEKISLLKKVIPIKRKRFQVLIAGQSGISVKFSKCCSPQPGDEISAFITKGEGASIHKINCANLKDLQEKWPQRIVKANWVNRESEKS